MTGLARTSGRDSGKHRVEGFGFRGLELIGLRV